jgi:hypothetical protein
MPEKKKSTFEVLNAVNVNEFTEKKGNFTYLSWAWAVRELLKVDPKATWIVHEYPDGNGYDVKQSPYMRTQAGCFVKVTLTVDGIDRAQVHPVLDNRNQTIDEPNAFQVNTSIQRCLAKVIALHGLGLYIYAGEDLPSYTPLTKEQVERLLKVAETLGEAKYIEVADGIDNQVVHSENYAITLKSLERRAKQDESS